ncbi:MFS transporter [Winogradskyella maritima]|uniref:Nitrate/nitrite transporter n=1 Tax=Winogradskyella maritima TaxID=1517766 RepID=A0ABV8AIT3_9FLAO|nr:MFS transporter [Winogradskyella maritima]
MTTEKEQKQPWFVIVLLILAAEAVFILPFVIQRIFRPVFLETFAINNEQIGYCFSVYGLVALASYFFGGPLADKFHPKNLMAIALIMTASGGIYLSTYPDYSNLKLLYGYWGFTTIFLFWAAMIKATRVWGGTSKQGMAFGFLDGGRGLVAALFGSLGVVIFSAVIGDKIDTISLVNKQDAFSQVILWSSAIVGLIGVSVFLFMGRLKGSQETLESNKENNIEAIKKVLTYRSTWYLMLIILCAYVAYKGTDMFTLYTSDVMGYDDIKSAHVGTALLYIRPIIGVTIGVLADRTRASLWLIIGFTLSVVASFVFASGYISEGKAILFGVNILAIAIGIYACRVLYFATLEEAKIPVALTGTTVGIISVVGYTPDIFSGPMFGILLDNPDKVLGLQHAFFVMGIFSLVGLVSAYLFYRLTKN